jgi:hypothetical protein
MPDPYSPAMLQLQKLSMAFDKIYQTIKDDGAPLGSNAYFTIRTVAVQSLNEIEEIFRKERQS